jgi:hypothetical protein
MNTRLARSILTAALLAAGAAIVHGQGRSAAVRPGDCPRDPVSFHPCALA